MIDDRVSCHDCANFDGSCSASSQAVPGAWVFMPTLIDIPRRCIFFAPQRSNQDRRTGAQRWPEFMAQYESVKKERARVRRETGQRGIGRANAEIKGGR